MRSLLISFAFTTRSMSFPDCLTLFCRADLRAFFSNSVPSSARARSHSEPFQLGKTPFAEQHAVVKETETEWEEILSQWSQPLRWSRLVCLSCRSHSDLQLWDDYTTNFILIPHVIPYISHRHVCNYPISNFILNSFLSGLRHQFTHSAKIWTVISREMLT